MHASHPGKAPTSLIRFKDAITELHLQRFCSAKAGVLQLYIHVL